MTITMYDASSNSQFPSGGQAYGGYVDGSLNSQPNYSWIVANFPNAHHLSITVTGMPADCLDIESGAATIADAEPWVRHQIAGGASRPVLYANASTMSALLNTTQIPRSLVRLWSAHYGAGEHICGPQTCNLMPESADGTQWADSVGSLSADQSVLSDGFFGGAVLPVTYANVTGSFPVLSGGMNDIALPHWYIHRLQAILAVVYGYEVVSDGSYGPVTTAAVKALQEHLGLVQDGVTGEVTWGKVIAGS